MKTDRFIEDEIVVIAAANHDWALRRTTKIDAAQLAEIPLIRRERGSRTRRVVEDALKKSRLKLRDLRVVMELDSTEAIKSAVEANLGIGFVSRWGLTKEIELGSLAVVNIENLLIKRQFQFIYPRTPKLEGAAEIFHRFARRRRPALDKN